MNRCMMLALALLLVLAPGQGSADTPLTTALALSMDQSRAVNEIEAGYRKQFASQRQEFNRESRALRRARLAFDSAETARLEGVTEGLRQGLIRLRQAWDDEIRTQLTAPQKLAFEAHVEQRRQMAGSSRDERLFED